MTRFSPSLAKNVLRRALHGVVDPPPSPADVEALWTYFGGRCAYCGVAIPRASRTGHLDHVVSLSDGGSNAVTNHVLSCAKCNGDDKRETTWRVFLQRTVADPAVRKERSRRIEGWLSCEDDRPRLTDADRRKVEATVAKAVAAVDEAVVTLRAIRARRKGTK